MYVQESRRDLTPILMLVPYFAPQTHAAMFRAHKLAKYLPSVGYRPVVVTTDINYLYNDAPALMDEFPPEVEIHRARFIEPTVRGVRMALGGRDRTFAALKRAAGGTHVGPPANAHANKVTSPRGRRWGLNTGELIRLVGEWPDRHWTWSLAAERLCRRLIQSQGIRLLYTSAVPVSPLRTAQRLQRKFGLKWVADFRDPVGYGDKHSATGIIASAMERRILQHSMHQADRVTGLADSYGQIFFDLYGLPEKRYRFIPTGLDEAYLGGSNSSERAPGMLLHVGEVMPNQSSYAFSVLAKVRAAAPEATAALHLVFVGRREINEPRVSALVSGISGWDVPIQFIDHAPQAEVYALARRAEACLLIPGRGRYWWTNFAKLVDYLALRVPVIADVPAMSEARQELTKTGQGFFLTDDVDADAAALIDWLQRSTASEINDYGKRYTAREQARAFAEVFDELLTVGAGR